MRPAFMTALAATLATQSHAFFSPVNFPLSFRPLQALRPNLRAPMSMSTAGVPILITGNNIEVTPALKKYVNDKFSNALNKVGKRVTKCDVHLIYDRNPSVPNPNHVEVTLFAKGATIRAHKNTEDMYATIDEVSDTIKNKLRKYKERLITAHRQGKPEAADMEPSEIRDFEMSNEEVMAELKETDLGVPLADLSKVQRKKFNMDPMTLEEAVMCLEYIDHDFYVFKNKENNKVQVIYNRKSGGVGLIEPE